MLNGSPLPRHTRCCVPGSTSRRSRLTIATALSLLVMACASLPQEQELQPSGFLNNYRGFRPAQDESGAWVSLKPDLDLKPYSKVMIDPLVIWYSPDTEYKGINTAEMWQLALAFHQRMVQALKDGYPVVNEPGPGVLRIRAAMTGVIMRRPTMASPGPLLPLASDLVLMGSQKVTGIGTFAGQAAIEAELLDSETGERLIGYIERRQSSRVYVTESDVSFAPILELFDYWATKLRQRLDERRGLREYHKEILIQAPR